MKTIAILLACVPLIAAAELQRPEDTIASLAAQAPGLSQKTRDEVLVGCKEPMKSQGVTACVKLAESAYHEQVRKYLENPPAPK